MASEPRGVQSIEMGGKLLTALVQIGRPAMLRDLALRAEMGAAQAHAYLVSFRKLGLVDQDRASGRYLLGPFALQLGLARLRGFDPLQKAANATRELAEELGFMVTVSVWGTHGPTIVQVQEAAHPVHVNLRAGAVFTLSGTATGQLFASFLPDSIIAPMLAAELAQTGGNRMIGRPTTPDAIPSATARIRARGFAITEGVPVPGVNAISVPVFDHDGQIQLAVTVIGHAERLPVAEDGLIVTRVAQFGRDLSAELGYSTACQSTMTEG